MINNACALLQETYSAFDNQTYDDMVTNKKCTIATYICD